MKRYPMLRVPALEDHAGGMFSPVDLMQDGGGLAQKLLHATLLVERENARRAENLRRHIKSVHSAKGGSTKRQKALELEFEVVDAHRRMRRHVSQREDARRIANQLGMPFETVRAILKRSRNSLT